MIKRTTNSRALTRSGANSVTLLSVRRKRSMTRTPSRISTYNIRDIVIFILMRRVENKQRAEFDKKMSKEEKKKAKADKKAEKEYDSR